MLNPLEKLNFKSLKAKLAFYFVLLGIVPLFVVSVIAFQRTSNALTEKRGLFLMRQAHDVAMVVNRNLFERYGDVQAFAFNPVARAADPSEIAQAANFYMTQYGVYDLMVIVDLGGNIIAANTVDFEGRPVNTASILGKSVLGERWFEEVRAGRVRSGETHIEDLAENRLASQVYGDKRLGLVFAAPVFGTDGKVERIWMNLASRDRVLGEITQEIHDDLIEAGLTSIEVQILNKDGFLVDDYDPEAILSDFNMVDSGLEAAKNAVQQKSGFLIEENVRRKVDQISSYAGAGGYKNFEGYGWGVLLRQDVKEATVDAWLLGRYILAIAVLAAVVVAFAGMYIAGGIAQPVMLTAKVLEKVAQGDLTQRLEINSEDEVGKMGHALNQALIAMQGSISGIEAQAGALAQASEELGSISRQLTSNADETSHRANSASASAEQVTRNVETVATATEEISSSIKDIAANALKASKVASSAAALAEQTNETVVKLGKSSNEIGEVNQVITSSSLKNSSYAAQSTLG